MYMQVGSLTSRSFVSLPSHSLELRFHLSFFLGYRENPVLDQHVPALGIPLFSLRVLPYLIQPLWIYLHPPPPPLQFHPSIVVSPIHHPPMILVAA
jgi:hypothetical protein